MKYLNKFNESMDDYYIKLPCTHFNHFNIVKRVDFSDQERNLIDNYLDKLPKEIEYQFLPPNSYTTSGFKSKDKYPLYRIYINEKLYLIIWKLHDDYFLVRNIGWEEWRCDQIDGLFKFIDWYIENTFNINIK